MSYTSVIRYTGTSTAANTTVYLPVATSGVGDTPTVEANAQIRWRTAGTFKNLRIFVHSSTSTNAITAVLRLNGVDTALSASITAGGTGEFTNLTNEVSVNAGDLAAVAVNRGGTESLAIAGFTVDFVANDATLTMRYGFTGLLGSYTNANTTRFIGLASAYVGNINTTAYITETNSQMNFQQSGTLKNLAVYLSANTRTTTSTARIRKNTANGNQVISITSASFGAFEDTTNTDTAAVNDIFNYSWAHGSGVGSPEIRSFSVDFQSDSKFGAANNSTVTTLVGQMETATTTTGTNAFASNTTRFSPVHGAPSSISTTNTNARTYIPSKGRIKETRVWIATNTSNTNTTLTVVLNNTDTSIVLTSTAGSTATLVDTSTTVEFAAGDAISMKVVRPTSTGAFVIRRIALVVEFDEFTPQTVMFA